MSTHIYHNGRNYTQGYTPYPAKTIHGTEYVEFYYSRQQGKSTLTAKSTVHTLEKLLSLLDDAGFEICPQCNGTKRIDPIENPPYPCPLCEGKGYMINS